MIVIHGWKYFVIDAFTLKDAGLSESTDGIVEIRQKYFHVFWIPISATGKDWVVHKTSGMYDLSDKDIMHIISDIGKPKTPWYAFAGPLICVGYSIVFMIISLLYH